MKKMKILLTIGVAVFCSMTVPAQTQPAPILAAGARLYPGINRVLTDAQRGSLRAALVGQRATIQPLTKRLRSSQFALLDLAAGGKFDEAAARREAEDAAKAETELAVIFVRALAQMQPPLSAQQIRQLRNFRAGRFQMPSGPTNESETERHLPLPPSLPRDTNDLPIVK